MGMGGGLGVAMGGLLRKRRATGGRLASEMGLDKVAFLWRSLLTRWGKVWYNEVGQVGQPTLQEEEDIMVTLQVRKIIYEEGQFEPEQVMTIREAADALGMTLDAVIAAVRGGRLTELLDPDATHQFKNRRFVLRAEVEEEAEKRQRVADKWA